MLQAQTSQPGLNQIELFKQFIGTWKCEVQKDTFLLIENTSFGTGMVSKSQVVSKGNTLEEIIQLYGYNAKDDSYQIAELMMSRSDLEIINARFITPVSGEMEVTNTENAKYQWRFEFKNQDTILQQAFYANKVVKEVMLSRVE